ncbi:MAG: hypothetical protein HYZ23_10025 [Chloroflexi bacterium]|nr:hypothetical protein [Chloroflexota bacterium]
MKKKRLLLVLSLTIITAAILATPALAARMVSPSYISAEIRQAVIQVYTPAILALTLIVYFSSGARKGSDKGLWITAMAFSLLCMAGIGVIWFLVAKSSPDENYSDHYHLVATVRDGETCEKINLNAPSVIPSAENPIYIRFIDNNMDVDCMKAEQDEISQEAQVEKPVYIPTGAFIQSIEYTSANNVLVTGYVWQKYSKDVPADISRGFILPEGDADVYYTRENAVYEREQDDEIVIGWYLNVTLRQTFDYSRYPFDRQDIWLRFWHQDFDRNVILVPDLKAYDIKGLWPHETDLFLGLERDFVLERYTLERTYFNYHYNNYTADFGIDSYVGQTAYPELYFNVGVRREVLDAFVAYLIPMLILILMSFGVQFIVTQIPDKMEMHGISTTGLIGYYASLFFIGILSQLDIRRTLNAPGVVYIEYFYFALYMILLLQTVNSVIFAATDDVGFLEYKDNLYPKLIFFPITLGLMFTITAWLFY